MNVKFNVRGVKELQTFLKTVPRGTVYSALKAFTEYVIGNEFHGLKHNETYKYVSRKTAYGQTFVSDKQRRWFFANNMQDKIGNNRTGRTSDGWQYVMKSDYRFTITNPEPGAYWTRDDKGQARQPAMVGWRKITQVIADNFDGAIRSATAAVSRWLKENRK